MYKKLLILLFVSTCALNLTAQTVNIKSPDGQIDYSFYLSEEGIPMWKTDFKNKPVIYPSALGITGYTNQLQLKETSDIAQDTIWHPVYGERKQVRDNYRGKLIRLNKEGNRHDLLLEVRVYNEGIAFRYIYDEHPDGGRYLRITNEETEFRLPEETKAWFTSTAQGGYELLPLKNWPGEAERPLTLALPSGMYACLAEAEMVNYSRTKFVTDPSKPNTVLCRQYDTVEEITPFTTPWRVVMMAEKPGTLLENNDILLNLNPPCVIANTEWIRPGKVMREVTLSTAGAKELVDFAVKRNLQYIHFDAGWYGYEYVKHSDATTVTVDPRRNAKGDLNLEEAIAYAKSKNIGVIVYVNQRALYEQLDEILPLYKKWGISGIKFGFVHVGSFRWTTWMHEAVKKCAEYGLVVDIHDEYRPTGFSRTYPNLLTQEGIRGNEEMPDATHNTILPFTRFIAGAGDYTICYYRQKAILEAEQKAQNAFTAPGRYIKTTSAHQLALSVICYSPLQYMYWYDKPSDCQDEPELAFFDKVPTVWDDTRVLGGTPGEYVSMARKSGNQWFIGLITNNEPRTVSVSFEYLEADKKYKATLYEDNDKIKTRTKVGKRTFTIDRTSTLQLALKASGGAALLIEEV